MIMKYNFDKIPNRRGTNSLKWDVDRKELPMWVADMDFETVPEVQEALVQRVAHGVYAVSYTHLDVYKRQACASMDMFL